MTVSQDFDSLLRDSAGRKLFTDFLHKVTKFFFISGVAKLRGVA
jgi:hypothetical protein